LKETSGWGENGNGSNTTGFSALPAGYRSGSLGFGYFNGIGENSSFWSATEYESGYAWFRDIWDDASCIFRGFSEMNSGYSIRCVKD